ncbi:hypothetical protein [Actinomadura sp. CNU-125]|uniref:hypothetical protein n=1 Tax=Actinomadura sp. CNU-125 TaxID=1904961 RepID=UPI0021CD01D5|nr:hypothetical protein [Actinomadura sp. CNU-125]
MGTDVQFVQDLVAEFPFFEETYDAHCYPDEDVLPHVVFWDITQAVVRAYLAHRTRTPWTGEPSSVSWKTGYKTKRPK